MDGPASQMPPRRSPATLESPLPKHLRDAGAEGARPGRSETADQEWVAARRGVDRNEADAELAVAAGMKHLVAGRLAAAYVELRRATELDPTSRHAELWRLVCEARIAKSEGHDEAARRKYTAVLELDPGHREALAATTEDQVDVTSKAGRLGRWFGGNRD